MGRRKLIRACLRLGIWRARAGFVPTAQLRCLGPDCRALVFIETREISYLHGHPLVHAHGRFVLQKEIPVKRGERASCGPCTFRWVVGTAGAVIAHPLDVLASGDVWLTGHETAVGVLRHAEGVREFDPFDGVDIDRQVPLMYLTRAHSEHERIEPRDHQSLDVMGVAEL